MSAPIPCRQGYYCPGGDAQGVKCPAGTYQNKTGASSATDCSDCPTGRYCLEGSINPTGPCQPGFYCQGGSPTMSPFAQNISKYPLNGPCPSGSYCPLGTTEPIKCDRGRYRNTTGAATALQCLPCTPGYYCKNYGSTYPTDKCAGGWYCPEGLMSKESTPENYTCPAGHFCPNGTALPKECETGMLILF